jgi:hypothetical protein
LFTEFVRTMADGAERLEGEVFAALWGELRIALRAELRRRGLWSAPPSYLGVFGWRTWEPNGERHERGERIDRHEAAGGAAIRRRIAGRDDALEELAAGCFTFIFVHRLRSLAAQLRVKPDVEGLVLLGIRHFLHELQRQHDPLGYRVFTVTRAAVRLALARGEISLAAGDPRVRNDTVLAFRPPAGGSGGAHGGTGDGSATRVAPAPGAELEMLVRRWNDSLLPDLVTAPGRAQEAVAERLSHCLSDLARHGIQTFRFKDLIDPLKRDVRSRWAAFLRQTEQPGGAPPGRNGDGQGVALAVERPDLDLEDRADLSALAGSVAAAVDRLDTDARTRDYLAKLWGFLGARAAQDHGGDGTAEGADGADRAAAADGAGRDSTHARALSHRKLARLLAIPRQRLPELHQTLGLLVDKCRAGGAHAANTANVANSANDANDANDANNPGVTGAAAGSALPATGAGPDRRAAAGPAAGAVRRR